MNPPPIKTTVTNKELLDRATNLLTECRKAMYMMDNPYVDYEVAELRALYNSIDIFLQGYEWLKTSSAQLKEEQNREAIHDM